MVKPTLWVSPCAVRFRGLFWGILRGVLRGLFGTIFQRAIPQCWLGCISGHDLTVFRSLLRESVNFVVFETFGSFYRSSESGLVGFINLDFINGNLLLVRTGHRLLLDFITGGFRSGNGTNQGHANNESEL